MHILDRTIVLPDGVQRLWGFYIDLLRSAEHTIKFLVIKEGQAISYQRHLARSEKWEIVRGTGLVYLYNGSSTNQFEVKAGDSFTVCLNEWHQVRAVGGDLVAYEHQFGAPACSEDDIERTGNVI